MARIELFEVHLRLFIWLSQSVDGPVSNPVGDPVSCPVGSPVGGSVESRATEEELG